MGRHGLGVAHARPVPFAGVVLLQDTALRTDLAIFRGA